MGWLQPEPVRVAKSGCDLDDGAGSRASSLLAQFHQSQFWAAKRLGGSERAAQSVAILPGEVVLIPVREYGIARQRSERE